MEPEGKLRGDVKGGGQTRDGPTASLRPLGFEPPQLGRGVLVRERRPGFGLAEYAHCLAALIEAISLGPAHVVGLSRGGTVVQELYRHHPELVGGCGVREQAREPDDPPGGSGGRRRACSGE